MNRIIKFRAWNKTIGCWEKDFHIEPDGSVWTIGRTASGGWAGTHKQNIEGRHEIIVQQFSALTDKNGKDIYEGDIIIFMGRWDENGNVLKPDYRKYEVVWFMGGLHAIIKTINSFHHHNECVGVGHTDSQILGNIFENPELLK